MPGKETTHGKDMIRRTAKKAARQWQKSAHGKQSTHGNGRNQHTAKIRCTAVFFAVYQDSTHGKGVALPCVFV
jgi:hypothetical protein